jgi:hypothetical protein
MTDETNFFVNPIQIKAKRIDINQKTFQPLLIVTMDIALTLERMQDHIAQNSAHFPPDAYEQIGREIFDAVQNAKDIPTDSPTGFFKYDPS